jgi:hypothetical protein
MTETKERRLTTKWESGEKIEIREGCVLLLLLLGFGGKKKRKKKSI